VTAGLLCRTRHTDRNEVRDQLPSQMPQLGTATLGKPLGNLWIWPRTPKAGPLAALVASTSSPVPAPGARNFRPNPASTGNPAAMKQEHGHRRQTSTAGTTRGCWRPAQTACINGWVTGIAVAPIGSSPASGHPPKLSVRPPGTTPRTSVLRWQVLGIIDEVLNNADTLPEARSGLLARIQENPGRPEQALLAHLQDREEPAGPSC
jgi:hypothetical protein